MAMESIFYVLDPRAICWHWSQSTGALNVGLGRETLWPVHSKVAHSSLSTLLQGVPYCGSGEAMSRENEHDTTLPFIGTPFFIELHFIVLCRYWFFFLNKGKVCGNPALSKFVGIIFPTLLAHFVSLSHFGGSHSISSLPLAKKITTPWRIRWWYLLKDRMMVSIFLSNIIF